MPSLAVVLDDDVLAFAEQTQLGGDEPIGHALSQRSQCGMNPARWNPLRDQSLGPAQKHQILEGQSKLTTLVAAGDHHPRAQVRPQARDADPEYRAHLSNRVHRKDYTPSRRILCLCANVRQAQRNSHCHVVRC